MIAMGIIAVGVLLVVFLLAVLFVLALITAGIALALYLVERRRIQKGRDEK